MTIEAIPTDYKGVRFRSKLEATWARWFDERGVRWVYEPEGYRLSDGTCYLPDFWLPDCRCFAEVKGVLRELDERKIRQMATECRKKGIGFAVLGPDVGGTTSLSNLHAQSAIEIDPRPPAPPPPPKPKGPVISVTEAALLRLLVESSRETLAEVRAREALRAVSSPLVLAALNAAAECERMGWPFDAHVAISAMRVVGASEADVVEIRDALKRLPEPDNLGQTVLHLMRTYVKRRLMDVSVMRANPADPEDQQEALRLDAEALALIQLRATLTARAS